ncbi:hypothetical protein ZWY2020_010335 [Hordeum vulgare]|nr:hypothetical protein ZWY2020_010335 [Hordeum vulgare]
MDSGSSSEVITHIEIQKEIDTIHVIIHIGFPNLLKKKGAIEELEKDLQKEINSVNRRIRERSTKGAIEELEKDLQKVPRS